MRSRNLQQDGLLGHKSSSGRWYLRRSGAGLGNLLGHDPILDNGSTALLQDCVSSSGADISTLMRALTLGSARMRAAVRLMA